MKLVTREQMNLIDHNATSIYQIPSLILMEHAGNGIFMDFIKRYSRKHKVLIVCGHGNNGGDGFVLARLLHINHYDVAINFIGDEHKLSEDSKINYISANALEIKFDCNYSQYDIIIDCIFGTGLCRAISGQYSAIIERINCSNKIIISVDIASGINCDTGELLGCAIKAQVTYTLEYGKVGLYVYPGRYYCGEIVVIPIHIPSELVNKYKNTTHLINKHEMIDLLPKRDAHSNKGSYGKVLCIGGSIGMSGAISLAARSALSSGCGLLTCAIPNGIKDIVATNLLESMHIILPEEDGHITKEAVTILQSKISQYSVILIGCGITRNKEIKAIMKMLLDSDIPLVIDADALYALKDLMHLYCNRKNIIITPHLKEFAYLMNEDVTTIMNHSIIYINKFNEQFPNYTLVLKSETTIICENENKFINTYGNNGLAVGGSGDVLAGLITGLYAQNKNTLNSATLGVFIHAYSADLLLKISNEYTMIPSDIIEQINKTITLLVKEKQND